MTGRLIRLTTALAVVAVAGVAAIISYQHAYELVRSHGDASLSQASIVPAQHCRATRERAWKPARIAASAEDAAVARHEYWRVAAARRSRTGLARGVPPATAATAR